MNQLTTTNNQFTLEETLMEKVFEAFDYQFTIITPNGGEPHFIAKEVSEAMGYSKSFSLSQYFEDKLIITKENGLLSIKNVLSGEHQRARSLALIPSSSLQEYLLRHSTRPKAKEIGDRLYEIFVGSNPVFNPEVLDDWGTSIEELTLTAPQLADVSKKINGFIFGLIKNDRVSKNLSQGYHNTTMAHFVYNVDAVRKEFKEMGVSSTLVSSRRVFLGYLDITSRQVIAFIDDMFIYEVTEKVNDLKDQGFSDKQISFLIFKKKNKKDKPIANMVNDVIEKYSHIIKTLYWMKETGKMKDKQVAFNNSKYVTSKDRDIRNRLSVEDWSSQDLLDKTIHKLIEKEGTKKW